MENKVKVSVIIPVYNTEKYVERCINSVLNQSLKEIEIIIINDGSTDSSLERINKFSNDERVKIIARENKGASKTRNEGLNLSAGEYIYYIDSDDYLEGNNVLETLYKKCEEENLDILNFNYWQVYEEKKLLYGIPCEEGLIDKKVYYSNILDMNGTGVCFKFVKSSLYKQNNILFPENIFHGEDMVVSIKLGYFAKKIGKINNIFYNYVQHREQGTKKSDNNKILEDMYQRTKILEEFCLGKEELKEIYNTLKLKLYYEFSKNKNHKYYIKLRKEFLREDKKELFKCEYYKKMPLKNKIKFYFRMILNI